MINYKLLYIFILLASFFVASCTSTEECRQEKTVKLTLGFYKKNATADSKISIDSIWVNGLSKDSFLYKNSKSIGSINLPLNITKQQSDFIIRLNNLKDTVSIFYTNNDAYFISLPCGCIATHTLDEVITTHHFIDSVRIVQREVLNINAEHIKIFHN